MKTTKSTCANTVHIAVCQTAVTADTSQNTTRAMHKIEQASAVGAQAVVLPEMFFCPYDLDVMAACAINDEAQVISNLQAQSGQLGILLIAGSFPEYHDGKLYNTCYVFEDGKLIGKHRKYHLFNIDIQGGIRFQESKIFTQGEQVTVVNTKFGKVGIAICFDIRFPELFKHMAMQGANLIVAPGAFNHVTGPLHWELSLRARAVDCQCFVVGCSPALNQELSYKAWGHSALVHPMGNILQMLDEREGMIVEEIDFAQVEQVRRELPLLKQTRLL